MAQDVIHVTMNKYVAQTTAQLFNKAAHFKVGPFTLQYGFTVVSFSLVSSLNFTFAVQFSY